MQSRARLRDEVEETTERLTDVLRSMSDGFVSVDREWRCTLVNPRAEEMMQRPASELLGRSMEELYPDSPALPYCRKVMEEREPQTFETFSPAAGRWVEIHAYPTAEGISILFADISERKRNEERERRHAATMGGVGTILQAALGTSTEEELGVACLRVVESLTGSAFGFVGELGPDGLLHDIALSDPGWAQYRTADKRGRRGTERAFAVHGLYDRVLTTGRAFFTNSPSEEPESIGTPEVHPPLTSFLGFPLISEGRTIGVVAVANREGGYGPDDAETAEALAPAIVEAFQRKRAEKESALAKARLDEHIDNSPLAVIEFDSEFCITRWSDEAAKMFGWTADEVFGKAIGEFRWVYEEDVAIVNEESRNLLTAATPRSLNVNRNYRKDGSVIWCEWYDSAIYDTEGNLVSILSQVLDITERREAEERLRESRGQIEAERRRLRTIIDETPIGITLLDARGAVLEVNAANERIWAGPPPKPGSPEEYGVYKAFRPDTGEPFSERDWPATRTIETNEPATETAEIERFDGTRAMVRFTSVPITNASGEMTGVVAITEDITEEAERRRFDEALNGIRSAVGATLDIGEIVRELGTRACETLGVDVAISLRRDERWVATDVRGAPEASGGRTFSDEELPLVREAIAERRPVCEVDSGKGAGKRRSAMRRFGMRSSLVVPLLAQGRPIGAIVFVRREAAGFSDLETYFATRLVSTATLALDNALAYERERAIADTLQQAVLSPPPEIAGIETAHLYRPASAEAAVGGDFYDVFELEGGRVGIVVGDVSGKGLEAARLTSLVRDGIRAYALERDDPAWVVAKLNALVYRTAPVESFATLFFGVLDVLSGRLRYTSAGHPPAILSSARAPRFLPGAPSAIVGAFETAPFEAAEETLGRQDCLLLYTDGVLEARGDGELYGDQRLLEAAERLRGTAPALLPQALLDDVLAFTGGALRDDTVIMVVRRFLEE